MRILAVTDYYRERVENGSEVFCSGLIDVLRRSHRIDVLARASTPEPDGPSLARWTVEDAVANDFEALGRFLRSHIDLGVYDCVYNAGALMFGCRVVQVLRSISPRLPLVNHFQALLGPYAAAEGRPKADRESHASGQRLAAAGACLNIFISRGELRAAIDSGMDLAEHSVLVVPNGLPFETYDQIRADRPRLEPLPASTLVIAAGGRFSDMAKGADLLYRAFAQLAAEVPDVFLLSMSNSDRFAHILQDVAPDRWRIERWLPRGRFLEMLAGADLVVIPSRYEPFGLIAIEALSLGVPVLGNAVGGLADIIRHGEFGMLNPLQDGSFGLFAAMLSLVSDRAGLRKMGAAGRKFVRREYALSRVAAQISAALESVSHSVAQVS